MAELVCVYRFDQVITPISAKALIKAIETAENKGAKYLVIELDTPGGLLEPTRSIVKKMLQSKVPIVVYVYPPGARAGSAGIFLVYAANIAVMAPGTHLGASHPVALFGKENKVMLKKVINDTLAWGKNLAELRHRNFNFLKQAVLKSKSITEKQALKLKVINFIASSLSEVYKKLKVKSPQVYVIKDSIRTKVLEVLTNPNLVYFLLLLGMLGIYLELAHPGAILPGVIGAISLILAWTGMSIIPVNYGGIALILLSALLFFLEVKIMSYGLLTIGAVISLILGSMMLFEGNPPALQVSKGFVFSIAVLFSLAFAGIGYLVIKTLKKRPISGKEALIEKVGRVVEEISPEKPGKVFVEGEIWIAESEESIKPGQKVRVKSSEGLKLKVEPLVEERSS
ncbi:MAG: nodulation protein NfeD [Thermodesulfobacteria bacterium]|nr:nodulation protein NfeD [Thermodesulfobacteriota bacterium]